MKGVFQIARFAGIPVKLHWSFGLLMLWVIYAAVSSGLDSRGVILSVVIVSVIFACVVMHEYGHALTARRYGVRTRDIILSPIGGIARLSHIPEKPAHEMLIALAGPAVNAVIALVLLAVISIGEQRFPGIFSPGFWSLTYEQSVLLVIAKINVFLVAFNLIPAFPMDGGRVLRSLLALRLERARATLIASYTGSAFAAVFILVGITQSEVILSLIGIFIFFAANQERRMANVRLRLRQITAGQICLRQPRVLLATRPMADVLGELPQDAADYLVADHRGNVTGILFAEMLEQVRTDHSATSPVGVYASTLFEGVDAGLSVADLIDMFRREGYRLVPVYDHGRLLGALHRRQLEYLLSGGDPGKFTGLPDLTGSPASP
ncbi:MAG: site-2 protease family protein [Saprospiraceae bacterium]|nr:site-2 protease family protein [Saprospiraceae bacterium]